MAGRETVVVPLRLSRDVVERLDEVAADELRSRSNMARALVIGGLYGDGYAFQGRYVEREDVREPFIPEVVTAPGGVADTEAVVRKAWAEVHAEAHEHPVVVCKPYVTTVDQREVRSDG